MKFCFWQKSIKLQSPSYLCKLISCATQEEIILNYNGVNKLDHDNRRSESYGSFKKNFAAIVRPVEKENLDLIIGKMDSFQIPQTQLSEFTKSIMQL